LDFYFINAERGVPVTLPETIVRRRCAALIPYARNARTHSDQQVAQIAASIREFGFTNPVLIDEEDGIIACHCRVLAAHLLGLDEVPCIVLAHSVLIAQAGQKDDPGLASAVYLANVG
jgi:ParB-like chromosome segregation protein Spo0J